MLEAILKVWPLALTLFLALLLGGCALAPQHVTIGTGTANNALTGNVVGMTGFVSATYDFP